MRRLSLLLVPLAALLALLWLGPRLTDWTARRDTLAALASDQLGRPVTLLGPVRLHLLPRPLIEAEGVTLGAPGDPTALTARALRLRLDGPSLLLGRLSPREVALLGAEIRLPWPPPAALQAAAPPLQAGLEEGRVVLQAAGGGAVVLERVSGRLALGGPRALQADGTFAWGGLEWRFDAALGHPGPDRAATLDLALSLAGAAVSARGVLLPEGALEGTLEAAGPDLSRLVSAPPGPFRARGRLTATAELLAADELELEVGGAPARGAVTLRLAPVPRLDAALVAARLDLDPWVAPLRRRDSGLPFGLDLSAEAASLGGVPLRRLRASVFREGERLTLTDVSALLPGDTAVELTGATAGERLEAALRFEGAALRATLEALGHDTGWLAPGRLRSGEGRARLVWEPGSVALPELAATLDGVRVSGAGVLRFGPRPALGLGLTLDRLDLGDWLRPGLDASGLSRLLGGFDANLRLAVEEARWGDLALERPALDAALENGRLTLRRLSGRLAGAEVIASGSALLGPAPRISDAVLDLSAPALRDLAALRPGRWPEGTALTSEPLSLRLSGGGPLDALALDLAAELGEARLEASGVLDAPARRGQGRLTLRHPGAPRLLADALSPDLRAWVGEGSLSLVAALAAGPDGVSAERFDLVAGGLRAGGQLALALAGERPALSGRLVAETLRLPRPDPRSREPLPLAALRGLDATLALSAERLETAGRAAGPARAALRLSGGRLAVESFEAALGTARLRGDLTLDASAAVPRLALRAELSDGVVEGPLTGLPLDLVSGVWEGRARLEAAGSSPAALLSTLSGEASLSASRATLAGLDAAAAASAAAAGDEAGLRRALAGGSTGLDRLRLALDLSAGRATLREAAGEGEGHLLALRGSLDAARETLDLAAAARPAADYAGPEVGLRITGPLARPARVSEIANWLRWRAGS